jgi:hypothetical protein
LGRERPTAYKRVYAQGGHSIGHRRFARVPRILFGEACSGEPGHRGAERRVTTWRARASRGTPCGNQFDSSKAP